MPVHRARRRHNQSSRNELIWLAIFSLHADTISLKEPATAEQAALAIQELFEQGVVAEEIKQAVLTAYQELGAGAVAVRSSATAEDLPEASFAGQQETFLHVTGEENLLRALRRCWSSLWTARALIYRARRQITPLSVRMAVIIQKMVDATSAGVLFTCNPVTGALNEMVINASWGLGEAIVSGHVTRDMITIDRERVGPNGDGSSHPTISSS